MVLANGGLWGGVYFRGIVEQGEEEIGFEVQRRESMQVPSEETKEFEERLERVKQNLDELNERIKARVKQNPIVCLTGALLVGFVIGKLVSR